MKLGYPCINRSIGCTANSTFRLSSYSEDLLVEKVGANLACLQRILEYNVGKGLLFFRISSDIVPFASHPVCAYDWARHFRDELRAIGRYIRGNGIRISMHPDQFILLNSPREDVVERSVAELGYHCKVLDGMGLGLDAKIQMHVGGVYGDREGAVRSFAQRYRKLPSRIRSRLVIENDDRLYSLGDCLLIHEKVRIPVLFDSFHHECLNGGEGMAQAIGLAEATWRKRDGALMTDYSSHAIGQRRGKHTESIDLRHFRKYLKQTEGYDFDIMLEIKDKERSAMKALDVLKKMKRL